MLLQFFFRYAEQIVVDDQELLNKSQIPIDPRRASRIVDPRRGSRIVEGSRIVDPRRGSRIVKLFDIPVVFIPLQDVSNISIHLDALPEPAIPYNWIAIKDGIGFALQEQ